jgi:hypothetical protein
MGFIVMEWIPDMLLKRQSKLTHHQTLLHGKYDQKVLVMLH